MKRFSTPVALIMAAFLITHCNLIGLQEDTSEAEQESLLIGLVSGIAIADGADLVLNGQWNSFTGDGTTSNTITTISAGQVTTGVWLDDSSTPYTSCFRIVQYSNENGYVITQNPPNNGACFSPDNNKGKYNKIVFFSDTFNDTAVYWHCSVAFGQDSIAEAVAAADTANRSDPTASTACGGFSPWSRLEKIQ